MIKNALHYKKHMNTHGHHHYIQKLRSSKAMLITFPSN